MSAAKSGSRAVAVTDYFCVEPQPGQGEQAELADLTARVAALEAGSPIVPEVAGSALAIGISLQRNSSGQMVAEDGSYQALKDGFAGFSTTVAAGAGSPVTVAGNNGIASGLSGIVKGTGYYVSAGLLIAESALQNWIDNIATPLVWYRFVGTGYSTTEIKQAWGGDPQQVP